MPTKPKTKEKKKPKVRGIAASTLELPEHFQATEAELAVLSRLARVMRQQSCQGAPWLGLFIEWLLYRENWDPDLRYQSSKDTFDAIKRMGGDDGGVFASTAAFIKAARRECPGITFVSATSAPKEGWGNELLPLDQEEQFYQILRMWRLEYPEPPKRPQFPKGRTQHDMDPDSD